MKLKELTDYLEKIPAIQTPVSSGIFENGIWWTKFSIDINHELAWRVVQELGHIINYLSIDERLPTVFYPVSPPSYLNGGPEQFLSWVIETKDSEFEPETLKAWLENRLPSVDDLEEWVIEE